MNRINILSRDSQWAIALIVAVGLLIWLTGLPGWINSAHATALTNVSDTLSDSDLSDFANHTVKFTTQSVISASSTIVITFDSNFGTTGFASSDATDYDMATSTADIVVNAVGTCDGVAGNTKFEITSIASNVFTFTHCNGSNDLPSGTAVTIEIGTNATFGGTGDSQIINPGSANSYKNTVTAPAADTADFQVAIIDDVTVTATVDTSLTFTIAGVASGQTNANGEGGITSSTTTATTISFGTLSTTANASTTARQDLTVATNATNGFTVTLQFDGALTSSGGADIDMFRDGAETATPEAWAQPAGTLSNENTYGHIGFTSADDLNTNEFGTGTTFYAGNAITAPRAVFENNGPGDGSTANVGATEIGFKIAIDSLQEAATDYSAVITYVATPTF